MPPSPNPNWPGHQRQFPYFHARIHKAFKPPYSTRCGRRLLLLVRGHDSISFGARTLNSVYFASAMPSLQVANINLMLKIDQPSYLSWLSSMQIGIASKDHAREVSLVQCKVRMKCIGMQVIVAQCKFIFSPPHPDVLTNFQRQVTSKNSCVDPVCSEYYFFLFDDAKKECYLVGYTKFVH